MEKDKLVTVGITYTMYESRVLSHWSPGDRASYRAGDPSAKRRFEEDARKIATSDARSGTVSVVVS